MSETGRETAPRMVEVSEDMLRKAQRIVRAAKASVEAWDGLRESARKFNAWSESDELIYQSPVQAELRESVR